MAHLTSEQRYAIAEMNANRYSIKEICALIGKDKLVLSREFKRNSDGRNGEYKADLAQRKYKTRQAQKPKYQSFTACIESKIEEGLSQDLSPEQIVGLSKKNSEKMVSVERIYQHIWQDKRNGGDLVHASAHTRQEIPKKRANYRQNWFDSAVHS